jgi:uncharacterized membrane protein YbhN (UPF0104 family)
MTDNLKPSNQPAASSRFKKIRDLVSTLFAIALLVWLVWYFCIHSAEFSKLKSFTVSKIMILAGLVLLNNLFLATKIRWMVSVFRVRISLWESYLLTLSGAFLNILPLGLGTAFRATYFWKVHGLKFVSYGVGHLGLLSSHFVASGVLALGFLLFLPQAPTFLFLVFAAFIVGPICIIVMAQIFQASRWGKRANAHEPRNFWERCYHNLVSSVKNMLENPGIFLRCLAVDICIGLTVGAQFWLVGGWLEYPMDYASGIVVQSMSRATTLVVFASSGAIGLREAFAGIATNALGVSNISGVFSAAVLRAIGSICVGVLGAASLFMLRRRIAIAISRKPSDAS